MQENNDLEHPRHGDPSSPDREDPYFSHTFPTKATQHRDASPRRGYGGGGSSYNPMEESKGPSNTMGSMGRQQQSFNQVTSSPGKNRIEKPAYFNS